MPLPSELSGRFRARRGHVKLPLTLTVRICAIEYAALLLNSAQRAAKDNSSAYDLR